jgi:hypothetical protein
MKHGRSHRLLMGELPLCGLKVYAATSCLQRQHFFMCSSVFIQILTLTLSNAAC